MAGKTVSIANTTGGMIVLKYRSPRSKRVVKYKCLPGEVTEVSESHLTVLLKNKVVEAMFKEKKLVKGKNAAKPVELPEGFEEDTTDDTDVDTDVDTSGDTSEDDEE